MASTGMMEEILCLCASCGAEIGAFFNHWARIGKGYVSPMVDVGANLAVVPHGPVRLGDRLTLVQGCHLQDTACAKCESTLGLKCLEVPINHVLNENQILFRLTSVRPVYAASGSPAELVVRRILKLREPPGSSSTVGDDGQHAPQSGPGARPLHEDAAAVDEVVDLLQIRADLEGQREDIDRIDTTGFKVVSKLDDAVARIETDVERMKRAVSDLRGDIRGNQDDMDSLKSDLKEIKGSVASEYASAISDIQAHVQSVDAAVTDLKRELGGISVQFRRDLAALQSDLRKTRRDVEGVQTALAGTVSKRDHAKEMAALRSEISQLRKEVEHERSVSAERGEASFPSRELDILTSSIAKIGNRASQVETLQMELQILKGRVERVEAGTKLSGDSRVSTQPVMEASPPPYAVHSNGQQMSGERDLRHGRRKRSSPVAQLGQAREEGAAKRAAFSSDVSPGISQEYEPASGWPASSPVAGDVSMVADSRSADKTRRSRGGGASDKRTQRRAPRKSLPH